MDEDWYERYQQLLNFRNQTGHTNVPQNVVSLDGKEYDGGGLSEWVIQQRNCMLLQHDRGGHSEDKRCHDLNGKNQCHNHNSISREKAALLEELNIIGCGPSSTTSTSTTNQNGNNSQQRKNNANMALLPQYEGQTGGTTTRPCSTDGTSSTTSHQEQTSLQADQQEKVPSHDMMDVADAFTIRAVLHSHERKRAHNELMHSSLKALFAEKIRTNSLFDNSAVDEKPRK